MSSSDPASSRFRVDDTTFELPVPGAHNVANALAAIAACRVLGVALEEMAAPLASFRGIGRRFQTVGKARGVEVIDDFAHNAEKIAAAIRTAKLRAQRVLAIYQPHGYGPTRFLRRDFVTTFARELGAGRPAMDARSVLRRAAPPRAISRRPTSWPRSARSAQGRVRRLAGVARRADRRRGEARRSRAGDGRARSVAQRAGARNPGRARTGRSRRRRNSGGSSSCRTGPGCMPPPSPRPPFEALRFCGLATAGASADERLGLAEQRRGHLLVETVDIVIGPHLADAVEGDGEIGEMHRHRPVERDAAVIAPWRADP